MENSADKNFKELAKKFGVKVLVSLLKGLVFLKNYLPAWFKKIEKPLKKLGWFFLLIFILPTYKFYLILKRLINKFYAPQISKHKFLHPFNRRYLIHLVIILITASIIAVNTNAYETRIEDIGKISIISHLVAEEEESGSIEIEEEGPMINAKRITRYLESTSVENKPVASLEEINKEILPPTAVGGSALVRPILSPAEAEMRKRDKIVYYKVQPGDSISIIAKKFGITNQTILWENNLTAYSIIRPGDSLTILPVSSIRHQVKKGETLPKIIKKYGLAAESIEKVIEINKLASAQDIQVGEKLIIPGGEKPVIVQTYSFSLPGTSRTTLPSTGKMLWPTTCRRITQYFIWRHGGIDIACGFGQPVYAANNGTIIKAQGGWNGGYGIMIVLDHGNSLQTLYSHLSKLLVRVGDKVSRGQVIGTQGSTGRSTGPHVHFEVRTAGARKNPLSYIRY